MNSNQINTLSAALATLITTVVSTIIAQQKEVTPSLVKTIPTAPTHIHPKAAPVVAATKGTKVVAKTVKATKLPMTPAGLIDITKLSGLVKARAVAANNRTIAALATKAA